MTPPARRLYFGNEGNDTIGAAGATAATIVGGNNSADGTDSIISGTGADFIFGNGGADTVFSDVGADTLVGGFGNDTIDAGGGNDLVFANEGNDTVATFTAGAKTVFGGQGNDSIRMRPAPGATPCRATRATTPSGAMPNIDTISGGSGNDVFAYSAASDDGNNAEGGGPVEFITDVDWSVDRFLTPSPSRSRPTRGRAPAPISTHRPTTPSPQPLRSAVAAAPWRRRSSPSPATPIWQSIRRRSGASSIPTISCSTSRE